MRFGHQTLPAEERAQAGDLLLLSLPRDRVVEIISKQEPGIRVRSLHANQVLSEQSEFVELVLSHNSPLLGQPISAFECHKFLFSEPLCLGGWSGYVSVFWDTKVKPFMSLVSEAMLPGW